MVYDTTSLSLTIGAQLLGIIAVLVGWRTGDRGVWNRSLWIVGALVVTLIGAIDAWTGLLGFLILLILGLTAWCIGTGFVRKYGAWTAFAALAGFFGAIQLELILRGWYAIPSTQDARLYGKWVSFGPVAENPSKYNSIILLEMEFKREYCWIPPFHGGRRWGTSGSELNVFCIHTDNAHLDRYKYFLNRGVGGSVLEISGRQFPPGITYKRVGVTQRRN